MNYDLRNKEDRKRFIRYANTLLSKQRTNVKLSDESARTLNQNNYIHVLCRILAAEIGVTEHYAKQVYFKELANPDIFITVTKDALTGKPVKFTRSTCDVTIPEMRKAITNFRNWAMENGYYLPEATLADDGTMSFTSNHEKEVFHKGEIAASKVEQYI